jgi:hypothetical protein
LVVGDAVCFVGGSHVDHAGIVFLVGVWMGSRADPNSTESCFFLADALVMTLHDISTKVKNVLFKITIIFC